MSPNPARADKTSFQEDGKPKYGNITTQIPKNKSIRALRMDIVYFMDAQNANIFIATSEERVQISEFAQRPSKVATKGLIPFI